MKRKTINIDNIPKPVGPYSHAVISEGKYMFLSGQIGFNKDGVLIGETIESQTRQILDNISLLLKSQNLSLKNIVKVTVLMTDLTEFDNMNRVYEEYFNDSKPARAAYEVRRLPKDVKIEIEAIAVC